MNEIIEIINLEERDKTFAKKKWTKPTLEIHKNNVIQSGLNPSSPEGSGSNYLS